MNYAIGNLNESYYKYLKKGRNSLAAVMPSKLSLFFLVHMAIIDLKCLKYRYM